MVVHDSCPRPPFLTSEVLSDIGLSKTTDPVGEKFGLLKDKKKSGATGASDSYDPWLLCSTVAFFLVLELISLIPTLRLCTFSFDRNVHSPGFIYS